VVQLGDAAGGYRTEAVARILAHWGATEAIRRDEAFRAVDSASLTFETLYVVASRAAPRATFAQFNRIEDATQLRFLSMLGVRGVPLARLLADDLADIRRANPRFRTYLGPGNAHTIMAQPEFYGLVVDGVALRDWVAGLLRGGSVPDVGRTLLVGGPP
jgi:hypothetical protein